LYRGRTFAVGLIKRRTFRSSHHTSSVVALEERRNVYYTKPREGSLSHNGVLFLGEFAEFRRDALKVLCQPLEDKKITVSGAKDSFIFPTSFMLVAVMNFCPRGNL
jgi:magnesium chelatase family protein